MIETNTSKPTKKKRTQSTDRITLSKTVIEKSNAWVNQVNKHFNGMIALKRNDIICALLEELTEKISHSVLEKIRSEKLTDIQKAKWIYQQLKAASSQKDGETVSFDNLVKTAQSSTKRDRKVIRAKADGTPQLTRGGKPTLDK